MAHKNFKKSLAKNLSILAVTPMVVNFILNNALVSKASMISRAGSRLANSVKGTSLSINNSKFKTNIPKTSSIKTTSSLASKSGINGDIIYTPSRSEKIMAGVGLGISAVSLIGTAVGIGLTETQYEQTKKTYDDVVDRSYSSFYQEREAYMKDLYDRWRVPMPDKYKNPYGNGNKEEHKPTPGFSIGGGK